MNPQQPTPDDGSPLMIDGKPAPQQDPTQDQWGAEYEEWLLTQDQPREE